MALSDRKFSQRCVGGDDRRIERDHRCGDRHVERPTRNAVLLARDATVDFPFCLGEFSISLRQDSSRDSNFSLAERAALGDRSTKVVDIHVPAFPADSLVVSGAFSWSHPTILPSAAAESITARTRHHPPHSMPNRPRRVRVTRQIHNLPTAASRSRTPGVVSPFCGARGLVSVSFHEAEVARG